MLFWSKIHVQISLHLTHLQKTRVSCRAFSYLFLLTQMCYFPPFSCPTIYFTTAASPYEALFPLHTTQGCPLPQPPQPALGRKQGRKGTRNHSPSLLIWSHITSWSRTRTPWDWKQTSSLPCTPAVPRRVQKTPQLCSCNQSFPHAGKSMAFYAVGTE